MKKLFVIGDPIEHSLSPIMHTAALKSMGLQQEYSYGTLRIPDSKLFSILARIRSGDIFGVNVTIPHKGKMSTLVDRLTTEAKCSSAVNTVYREGDFVIGHNTDGIGCMRAFAEKNVSATGKNICVLGAGGAARGAIYSVSTQFPAHVYVANRTIDTARLLVQDFSRVLPIPFSAIPYSELTSVVPMCDIIMQCTPLGKNGERIFDYSLLSKKHVVLEMVYPFTPLLLDAREKGCVVIDGLLVLAYQGAASLSLWTQQEVPIDAMKEALRSYAQQNV